MTIHFIEPGLSVDRSGEKTLVDNGKLKLLAAPSIEWEGKLIIYSDTGETGTFIAVYDLVNELIVFNDDFIEDEIVELVEAFGYKRNRRMDGFLIGLLQSANMAN